MKSPKPPTAPPTGPLSTEDLRQAIDLGTKMAESEALLMLERKRRQARKSETFTVRDTGHIDGGAYRVVRLADGFERVEGWGAKAWTPGGSTFWEIANAPPVSPRFAAELGIPLSDLDLISR